MKIVMNEDDRKIIEQLWSFSSDRRESIFKEFLNQAFRLHADQFIDFTGDGYPTSCFWEQKIELESLGKPPLIADESLSSISSSSNEDLFAPPCSPLHDDITNSPFPNFDESNQASIASSLVHKNLQSQDVVRNHQESSQSLQEEDIDQVNESGEEVCEEASPSDSGRSEAWNEIESLLKKNEISSSDPLGRSEDDDNSPQILETSPDNSDLNQDSLSTIIEASESIPEESIPFLDPTSATTEVVPDKDDENPEENSLDNVTDSQKTDACSLSQISELSFPDIDGLYASQPPVLVPNKDIPGHVPSEDIEDKVSSTEPSTDLIGIGNSKTVIEYVRNPIEEVKSSVTCESQEPEISRKSKQSSKPKKSDVPPKKVKNSLTSEPSCDPPTRARSQRGEVPFDTSEPRATNKQPRKRSDDHESPDEDDDACDVSLWEAFDDIETYEGFSQSRKRVKKNSPVERSRKKKTFEEKFFEKYPDAKCQIYKHEAKIHVLRSQLWMLESDDPASIIDETYTAMHNNMFRDVVRESALHAHRESFAFNSLPPLDDDDDIMEIPVMMRSNINLNRNRILSDSESDCSDNEINHDDDQPSTSTGRKRSKRVRMSTSNRAKKPRRVSDADSDDKTDDEPWNLPQYSGGDDDDDDGIEEVEKVRKIREKNSNTNISTNTNTNTNTTMSKKTNTQTNSLTNIDTSSEPRFRRKKSFDSGGKQSSSLNFTKRYASKFSIRERQLKRISSMNNGIRGSTDDEMAINSDNQGVENIPPGSNMPQYLPISVTSPLKRGRKNIRDLKDDDEITKASRRANEREKKRLQRVMRINKLLEKCPATKDEKRLILDVDPKTHEPRVEVHPELVKHLKDHQFEGIQFMYTNTIENVDLLKEDHEGTGCIIAHCMGLGKTLQVIAYVHTILNHPLLRNEFRKIMIAAPVNTLKNWYDEFRKWLPNPDALNIYQMADLKDNLNRAKMLGRWYDQGGVLIIGLQGFTTLSKFFNYKTTNTPSAFKNIEVAFINPGPDILIIDEGHLLKNDKSKNFQAFCKVPTERKIILTGTPLQNNLEEYYTMIDLIKPRLLGTKKEFANRFKNPIENGQHADSTREDILTMKRRCIVLDRLLTGSVQRFDYEVLKPYLEPKYEYSIFVQATDLVIELYNYYLDNVTSRGYRGLLGDSILLRLICNHPAILPIRSEKEAKFAALRARKNMQKSGRTKESTNQECDLSEEPDEDQIIVIRKDLVDESNQTIPNTASGSDGSAQPADKSIDDNSAEWFRKFMKDGESFRKIELSAKFVCFFFILEQCVIKNEKLIVVSQCLETLDLIEEFLASHKKIRSSPTQAREIEWIKDRSYFRIDGSVPPDRRKLYIDTFNNPNNREAKMFLLAVKAGGLGVNLIGANRAIIFDTHWNPMIDMQAIFRIYRLGQTRPAYIYRLITKDTLEEKIYFKQILKTGLSMRVVDKTNIQNSVRKADVEEYYSIRPQKSSESSQLPSVPKDDLLGDLILAHKDCIVEYREQDSLLQKKPEEDLDEQQRQQAWEDYERERDEEKRRSELAAQEAKRIADLEKKLMEDESRANPSGVQQANSETDSAEESPTGAIQQPSVSTNTVTTTSNSLQNLPAPQPQISSHESNGNIPPANRIVPQIYCGNTGSVSTNSSTPAQASTPSTSMGTTAEQSSVHKKSRTKKNLTPVKPTSSVFAENEALLNAFPTRKTYSFEDPSRQRAHVPPNLNGTANMRMAPKSSASINSANENPYRPVRPIQPIRPPVRISQPKQPTILQKTRDGHLQVTSHPYPAHTTSISSMPQQYGNLQQNVNNYSRSQYRMDSNMNGQVYAQGRVEQSQITNVIPQRNDISPVVDSEIGDLINRYLGDANLEDLTSLVQEAFDSTATRSDKRVVSRENQSLTSSVGSSPSSTMRLYNSTSSNSVPKVNGQQNSGLSNPPMNPPASTFPAFPSNVQQHPPPSPVTESQPTHRPNHKISVILNEKSSIINDEDLSNGLLQGLSLVDCSLFQLCEKLIDSNMRSRAVDQEAILKTIQDCLEDFIDTVRHRKFQASISNTIVNLKLASSCDKILRHLDEELPEAKISDPTTGAPFVLDRDITRGALNIIALRLVID